MSNVSMSDIGPWLPAMVFYVGSIYCGSKALSHFPVPVFLLSHGASDAILILCDRYLPSGAVHFSLPLKISSVFFALWSVESDSSAFDLTWIILNSVFSGAYRTASFWYTTPQWPYSGLSVIQRQYLNNLLGLVTFFPLAFFLGHHLQVKNYFQYLGEIRFYVGCICSGVLGWAVNFMWSKINVRSALAYVHMVQLAGKIATILISFHLFPVGHTTMLWLAIFLGVSGDVCHILGNISESTPEQGHDISDVLIGS